MSLKANAGLQTLAQAQWPVPAMPGNACGYTVVAHRAEILNALQGLLRLSVAAVFSAQTPHLLR
ncbi:hypothetical protein CK621_08105 [Vandammella animalimorsus]|uniref:Uncharacterized protein n=1 Tax=Vandammella animalimorsus TaxID=2029117 RepID=A0A2A2AVL8_9BURK|nr:hypothetical protein CK621_08105 [Vandammella animalimorsus]